MMQRPTLCTLVLFLLALPHAAFGWEGRIEDAGDHLIVHNPALPASPVALEELWRLDGDDEESEDFFGVLSHATFGPEGEVYLLDQQLHEVKVYSAEGEFLRAIGREGEGPGEFRRPAGLFFLPDGRLGVLQSRPARVVLLDREGFPAGDILFPSPEDGGFRGVNAADCAGGRLGLIGFDFVRNESGGERSSSLALMDLATASLVTLDSRSSSFDFARPVIRELESHYLWTLLPGDRVALVDDFDYRIRIFGPEGGVEREIGMDYADATRDGTRLAAREEELQSAGFFRGRRGRSMQIEVAVEPREPGIAWMGVDGAGRLWVLSGREALRGGDAGLGTFEVFDAEGRLQHRVTLAGQGDLRRDRLIMEGDRLLVLKEFRSAARAMRGQEGEDEDAEEFAEPMSVICYRLPDLDA